MQLGLEDRVVLVTGATTGIGKAVARAFGAERARVALTYHAKQEAADACAAGIESAGGHAMVVRLALEDPATIAEAVTTIERRWGAVEVLIANAVAWPNAFYTIEELPLDVLERSLRANVVGQVALLQAVVPAMRRARWGRIVVVSTPLAIDGGARTTAYSATKGALHTITRTLAREVGADGVLANVLLAGAVDSEARPRPPWLRDAFARYTMTGRLTEADEVARTAVFLGSAANGHVHGELLRCDGFIVNPPRIDAPASP